MGNPAKKKPQRTFRLSEPLHYRLPVPCLSPHSKSTDSPHVLSLPLFQIFQNSRADHKSKSYQSPPQTAPLHSSPLLSPTPLRESSHSLRFLFLFFFFFFFFLTSLFLNKIPS